MTLPTSFFIHSGGAGLFDFTSQTFITNVAGREGPTSLPYTSNYDSEYFSLVDGIQTFTVPKDGNYSYTIKGASSMRQMYNNTAGDGYGRGASFTGTVSLLSGMKLYILIGQMPYNTHGITTVYTGGTHSTGSMFVGGAGGTFVGFGDSLATSEPLLVAGGGGSHRTNFTYNATLLDARMDFITSGHDGGGVVENNQSNVGGIDGNGGASISNGGNGSAGAGFYGNATGFANPEAQSFRNGGEGADVISEPSTPNGGFGGGGGGGWGGSGGGGGYSGGGGGTNQGAYGYGGGGSNFKDSTKVLTASTPVIHSGAGEFTLSI